MKKAPSRDIDHALYFNLSFFSFFFALKSSNMLCTLQTSSNVQKISNLNGLFIWLAKLSSL